MAEVIGVRFRDVGKIYYFDPLGISFNKNDKVIVETARGVECGEVAMANADVDERQIVRPLKTVMRKADDRDLRILAENAEKERSAYEIALHKIAAHGLDMKLVNVEYTFDNSKILFFYTAPTRVDFRELVKDLAGQFRVRIELRQIGVRDECKKLGGLSVCGRPYCCSQFLTDMQQITIKMVKEQGISLNPTKISGACGKLMCCFKFEQDAYEQLHAITPRVGAIVKTSEGKGRVIDANLLTGMLKVHVETPRDTTDIVVNRNDIKLVRDTGKEDPSEGEEVRT
ncbi:MAG: stage 0 sporulation family protein [Clostridia bacterium]|nr:stage 0 sporulation family protein [Clostridia bacterium]MBR5426731.1 stage 0 sporulation family protein [Clostridia bacterium]